MTLAKPVPVFIVYGTALAYANGEVHFSDDVYGFDAKLAAALVKGLSVPVSCVLRSSGEADSSLTTPNLPQRRMLFGDP